MKKLFATALLVFVFSAAVSAQEYLTNVAYSIGLPMNKTSDFINQTSYIGFVIDGRRFINKNVTAGISIGWNVFHYEAHKTVEFDNIAATGRQYRYINSWPITLNMHYYFGNRRSIRPFIGLNAGVQYMYQRLEFGVFVRNTDNWHFLLAPEGGLLIPLSREVSFFASAKYHYAFDSGSTVLDDPDNTQEYVSINLGFSFLGF